MTFLDCVVTEVVHRIVCGAQTAYNCEEVIEEVSPESCAVRAEADAWHIAEDGQVFCECCWDQLQDKVDVENFLKDDPAEE